jgi:hypothetical protein
MDGIPRGIEALIKEASIDPTFRELQPEKPVEADAKPAIQCRNRMPWHGSVLPRAR